jgi:hypothetical protein
MRDHGLEEVVAGEELDVLLESGGFQIEGSQRIALVSDG